MVNYSDKNLKKRSQISYQTVSLQVHMKFLKEKVEEPLQTFLQVKLTAEEGDNIFQSCLPPEMREEEHSQ